MLATAEVFLTQARDAVRKCEAQAGHDEGVVAKMKERIEAIDEVRKR